VLDFGLAKLSEPGATATVSTGNEDATRLQVNTSPGVMGTASYMSPEQARGSITDARTDLWSLGVVLYEMIGRRVPFSGETINHTIVAILEKEPQPLENSPPELQRIVRKALTKDVDMRYQSARDLLIDLKTCAGISTFKVNLSVLLFLIAIRGQVAYRERHTNLRRRNEKRADHSDCRSNNISSSLEYAVTQVKSHKLATSLAVVIVVALLSAAGYFALVSRGNRNTQINSIAVMPFENRGGNSDSEYLSDGLTESLIYRLSQLPNLKVSPTSSVLRYKGKEIDPQKIATELGVNSVMSGRMIQRGDNLTISVELIDTANNRILWGEQYERKTSDLLTMQREIATTITEKLQLKLSGDDAKGVTKKYTDSNEAYQLYLKGRFYWNKRTVDGLKQAAAFYKQATQTDPSFALAYQVWPKLMSYFLFTASRHQKTACLARRQH
jgi:TolB-like protein